MQDDPDEFGGIVENSICDSGDPVVLEVNILHPRGHKWHMLEVAAVAVHSVGVGRRALTLQGAV